MPLNELFGTLRAPYGVCAYKSNGMAPMLAIEVQPCSEANIPCQSGLFSAYPWPALRKDPDGTSLAPKIGPFLCGGPDWQDMLDRGETMRQPAPGRA
jgi:hypothetical protein